MNASVTTHLGIYTEDGFLDRETCEALKAQMRAGSHARARIYDREYGETLNESQRSTIQIKVPEGVASSVREKLLARREGLSLSFGVGLEGCQGPTFLIYRPGDFFEPHRDDSKRENAPDTLKQRKVSTIVFLGDESARGVEGEYDGGSLAFYGLLKDPRCQHIGIPVRGRAGLLVAFRSDVFHQVSPVTRGERFTVVSWFY
jgi:SM-20-related protein